MFMASDTFMADGARTHLLFRQGCEAGSAVCRIVQLLKVGQIEFVLTDYHSEPSELFVSGKTGVFVESGNGCSQGRRSLHSLTVAKNVAAQGL